MTVTTTNPVRSDVRGPSTSADRTVRTSTPSRTWAFAGIGAAICCAATVVTSSMVDVVYRPEFSGTTDGVAAELGEKTAVVVALHTVGMLAAVLLVVLGAGLHRRLRHTVPDSLAPMLAFGGLAGSAVVSVMGAGLDTEFLAAGTGDIPDSSAAFYNNWVGTIPWLYVLAGLAGIALFSAARQGGVPRWIGRVGLVFGGLTVALGVSPLEYMAAIPAFVMLLVTSLGFVLGDREYRSGAR